MDDTRPSTLQRVTLWIALGLTLVLILHGAIRYGFTPEVDQRFWQDLFARAGGPMSFRFLLQPTMALLAAIPDGRRDARQGHSHFYWTSRSDTSLRRGRLWQGLYATARILLLGLAMDIIYQYRVNDRFYPGEAAAISLLLAVLPYFIWRWLVERIALSRDRRHTGEGARHAH